MRVTPPSNGHAPRGRASLFPVDNLKPAVNDKSAVNATILRAKSDPAASPITNPSWMTEEMTPSNRSSSKRVENRRCDFANIKSMFLEREKKAGGDSGRDDARRKSSNDVTNLKAAFEKTRSTSVNNGNSNSNNNNRCSTPSLYRYSSTGENNVSVKMSAMSSDADGQRNSYGGRPSASKPTYLGSTTQKKEGNVLDAFRKSRNDVAKAKSTEKSDENNEELDNGEQDNGEGVEIPIDDLCGDYANVDEMMKLRSSSSEEENISENGGEIDVNSILGEKRRSFQIDSEIASNDYANIDEIVKLGSKHVTLEEEGKSPDYENLDELKTKSIEVLEDTDKADRKPTLQEKRKNFRNRAKIVSMNIEKRAELESMVKERKASSKSLDENDIIRNQNEEEVKIEENEQKEKTELVNEEETDNDKEENKEGIVQENGQTQTVKIAEKDDENENEEEEESPGKFHLESYSDYANLHKIMKRKSSYKQLAIQEIPIGDAEEFSDYAHVDKTIKSKSSSEEKTERQEKQEDDAFSDYANLDHVIQSKSNCKDKEECPKKEEGDSYNDYANLDDLLTPTIPKNEEVFTFDGTDSNHDYADLDDILKSRSEDKDEENKDCEECTNLCSDYANIDMIMNSDHVPKPQDICKFAASAMECDFENLDDLNLTPTYQDKDDVFTFNQADIEYRNTKNSSYPTRRNDKRGAISEYHERNSIELPKYPDRYSAEFYKYPERSSGEFARYVARDSADFDKYVARNSAEFDADFDKYVARNSAEFDKYVARNSAEFDKYVARNSAELSKYADRISGEYGNQDNTMWRQPSFREHLASPEMSGDNDIYQTLSLAPEFFRKQRQNILLRRRGAKDENQRPSSTIVAPEESQKPCTPQECRRAATLSKRSRSVVRDHRGSNGYMLIKRRSLPVTSTEKQMSEIEEEKHDHSDMKEPDIQVSRYPHKCSCSFDDSHFLSRQRYALMRKRRGSKERNLDSDHIMEEGWRKQSPSPSNRSSQTMSSDLSECGISECGSENFEADSGYTSDILQSSLSSIDSNQNNTDICRHDSCQRDDSPIPPPIPDHGCHHHHHEDDSEKRLSLDSTLKTLGIQPETANDKKNRGMSFGKQLGKRLARKIKSPAHDTVHGIQYAVTNQDYEMLSKLLAAPDAAHYINHLHPPGVAVLHQACVLGNFNIVKLLVQKGADVRLKTWRNLSPTKLAAICGHFDIAQLLLLTGADVNDVKHGI